MEEISRPGALPPVAPNIQFGGVSYSAASRHSATTPDGVVAGNPGAAAEEAEGRPDGPPSAGDLRRAHRPV